MAVVRKSPAHSTASTNVADLLERVLDKGVVIAGDIKVSLLDIELLTIQIRLVVCSIDKAKEMGMDWWANSPIFSAPSSDADEEKTKQLEDRIQLLESALERATRGLEASAAAMDAAALPATSTQPKEPEANDGPPASNRARLARPNDPEAAA